MPQTDIDRLFEMMADIGRRMDALREALSQRIDSLSVDVAGIKPTCREKHEALEKAAHTYEARLEDHQTRLVAVEKLAADNSRLANTTRRLLWILTVAIVGVAAKYLFPHLPI